MANQRHACVVVVALIGVLGFSTFVDAQTTTATLGGTVVDESEAGVPDAQILIVNLGTGLRRATASDARGGFALPLLPPGRYRLNARRDGFSTTEIAELVLNVGDDLKTKILLKVASLDTAVTVTARSPPISTLPAVG